MILGTLYIHALRDFLRVFEIKRFAIYLIYCNFPVGSDRQGGDGDQEQGQDEGLPEEGVTGELEGRQQDHSAIILD